jgi:hypothetical protein
MTTINIEKVSKYMGGVAIILIGAFFMLGIVPNMSVQAERKVSEVQTVKSNLFEASQALCEAKTVELTNNVLEGEGSAELAGKQIDQLKDADGCKRFSAQVLLDEIAAKK